MPRRKREAPPAVAKPFDITQVRALSTNKFCKVYGISRQTVWRLRKSGRLKAIELTPGKPLILLEGVETVLPSATVTPLRVVETPPSEAAELVSEDADSPRSRLRAPRPETTS
jgi:hypothetical protein